MSEPTDHDPESVFLSRPPRGRLARPQPSVGRGGPLEGAGEVIDLVAVRVARRRNGTVVAKGAGTGEGCDAGPRAAARSGSDTRRHPRRVKRLRTAKIADLDDRFLTECAIRDLSTGGARLVVAAAVALPDVIVLFDELEGTIVPATLRWRRGNEVGVSFDVPPARLGQFRSRRLRALARRYYAVED
ncbi:PilZ domain-containing protein [Breoghania sp. JC706]|uniref:PilZ domain-containing protein n=1 Tax=Breoghania sp. JC706 TaxID=3117732 RepID=UPI0030083509